MTTVFTCAFGVYKATAYKQKEKKNDSTYHISV